MAAAEAIEMPVVKKDKKAQVSDLVEMGRDKGKLTTQGDHGRAGGSGLRSGADG